MLVMGRYLMSFARANELFLTDQQDNEGPAKMQCLGSKWKFDRSWTGFHLKKLFRTQK